MNAPFKPIPERGGVTPEIFDKEILPAGLPVVMRGLAAHWPAVRIGKESPEALFAYLRKFDSGEKVEGSYGPPEIKGRYSYNADLSGFNFERRSASFGEMLDMIARCASDAPVALTVQSAPIGKHLPGFETENAIPMLEGVEPRAWIGTKATIAAHHDPWDNVACVITGRRRFTLFAPDQVANLYVGPFELTPAGAVISLVDFDAPHFERFPKFREALDAAVTAELEPGDAIFIPCMWWHHVRAEAPLNMLVNYWWGPPPAGRCDPRFAFMHALLAFREMPIHHRLGWRALFDQYAFEVNGPSGDHLPPQRRGILGRLSRSDVRALSAIIARTLAEDE